MKVMKKILLFTMIIVLSLAFIQNSVMAYDWATEINDAAKASAANEASAAVTATKNIAQSIITIVRVICLGVAITMLIVLAIKYMSSAPGDKATIKKSAVTYVVGAIVMFASYGILTIIQQFAKGVK